MTSPAEIHGLFAPHNGGRVLDVATGAGDFIRFLAENLPGCTHFIGIDIRAENVAAARQSFASNPLPGTLSAGFILMDAADMTFPDSSFDTVAVSHSLHHLPDPDRCLAEMNRVLVPEGLFIVRESFADNQNEAQTTYVLLHSLWAEIHTRQGISHRPTYLRWQILNIIGRLGLLRTEVVELSDPDSDPKDENTLRALTERHNQILEGIRHHPDYASLKAEGEKLLERAHTIGCLRPTELLIIGKKKPA